MGVGGGVKGALYLADIASGDASPERIHFHVAHEVTKTRMPTKMITMRPVIIPAPSLKCAITDHVVRACQVTSAAAGSARLL